jgi:hypothetical protein
MPGWIARLDRGPPSADVVLWAIGTHALPLALWEVRGPAGEYHLDLYGEVADFVVKEFPGAGFVGPSGQPAQWDEFTEGAILGRPLGLGRQEEAGRVQGSLPGVRGPFQILALV